MIQLISSYLITKNNIYIFYVIQNTISTMIVKYIKLRVNHIELQ